MTVEKKTFGRKARLRTRSDFASFFSPKKLKISLGPAVVYYVPNSLENPRLAFSFKAKINAVKRNRIRRKAREFFRIHQKTLKGFDFNFVVTRVEGDFFKFDQSLDGLLEQFLEKFQTPRSAGRTS